MAAPLPTSKQSVDLSSGAKVSRIRRDPPAKVQQINVMDPEDRDRRDVVVGIAVFALALFVVIAAFASYGGWSPRNYVVQIEE